MLTTFEPSAVSGRRRPKYFECDTTGRMVYAGPYVPPNERSSIMSPTKAQSKRLRNPRPSADRSVRESVHGLVSGSVRGSVRRATVNEGLGAVPPTVDLRFLTE
ncbi:hypothetical protein K470DRAFT_294695 [Piedraia hortae CBS 480.64]|uniref:Uncharacterized protein n=1 Tax=Piedraia hortae CBS 480.64 TaxID=1314780 RepID=A0A6A7BZY9_9PEZI|nr:hypothetical protein K470DRAFT_294695 [Piedraia hortae CBS 480.64]